MKKIKSMIASDNPFRLYYHHIKGIIANLKYGNPSRNMTVIGVTGTNGKSTTSNIIARGLKAMGKKVFMFSTVNIIIDDIEYTNETKMTSPDPFLLQKLLYDAKKKGCEYAIIETTSHAILMKRNWGISYDIAVLTNITQDHLDLHKTMQNYVQTKLKLFKGLISSRRKPGVKKSAVINYDSDYKELFLAEAYDSVLTYGKDTQTNIRYENVENTLDGTSFDVRLAGTSFKVKTKMRGLFNVYNVLAAIGTFVSIGLKPNDIQKSLENFCGVPGRMEEIHAKDGAIIFIDYAHTPDALTQVLTTIREIKGINKIITVFGATGDRDKTKRPIMGSIVSELSDIVILTQDDDYTEKTQSVIKDILPGIERKEGEDFWIVPDRKEAIRTGIIAAGKNDVVLIAGKGDEHTLITNEGPIKWHDKEIAQEILKGIEDNTLVK